jgi:hypothetical protein
MTVGHALAAAGGARRLDPEEAGAHIEIVRLRERLRQGQDSYGLALVRHARWAAEARDAEDFEVPAEAARYLSSERLQQTLASEQQILRGRNSNFRSLLNMLKAQTAALNEEVEERKQNATAKEKEQALLQKETEYVDSLMQRGLTPRTTRVIELARLATQVDGERRQILSNIARARQEIIRLEHERSNAGTQHQLEALTGLKEVEDQMAGLRVTLEEVRSGLALLSDALPAEETPLGAPPNGKVEILRMRAAPPQRIEANEDTPLLPGDLVDFSPRRAGATGRVALGQPR